MIRQHLPRALYGEKHFRWRGGDVSRIEALTDAVFALALTLLIVSLEIPTNFDQLSMAFRQAPVFAVCFVLLVMLWFYHYQFHRRFGFEDFLTVVLNMALLFAVLIYVYPLKYLFTLLFEKFFGIRAGVEHPTVGQWPTLMILYSSGVVVIFGLFALMNLRAWRRREDLGLDEKERIITRGSIRAHGISAGIGVASIGIAALTPWFGLAGAIYFLMGPLHAANGFLTGARVERVERATAAAAD